MTDNKTSGSGENRDQIQAEFAEAVSALTRERREALIAALKALAEKEGLGSGAPVEVDWGSVDEALELHPNGPQHQTQKSGRHNVRPTSIWAKKRAAKNEKHQRELLLALFKKAGTKGLTDQESSDRLGFLLQSVTPLRGGLVRSGEVCAAERYRPTKTGSDAIVWVLREFATPEEIERAQEWVPTGIARRILDALLIVGEAGVTDKDGSEKLGINLGSYRQSRRVLVDAGLAKWSGRYVIGKLGKKRKVWIAAGTSQGGQA